ncbi:MAG: GFA family protein, partial [Rhodobacterales bacterium]|nr:GFA family protein [Rhodobacterales bacterium]
MPTDPVPGGCLCGAVTFALMPPLDGVIVCHCADCRRSSGHVWASVPVPTDRLHLHGAAGLRWFAGAPGVERGFCGLCGASLFWRSAGAGLMAVA